jgi:hypothetical protein
LGHRILVFHELQRGHDAVLESKVGVECGRGCGEARRQDGRDNCAGGDADCTCSRKPCRRNNHVRTKAQDECCCEGDRDGRRYARMSDERNQQKAPAASDDSIDKDLGSADRRSSHATSSER